MWQRNQRAEVRQMKLMKLRRRSPHQKLERAGEVVDRLSKRIGEWANVATMQAVVAYARVREGAEDIWAEAQNIRRRGRS